MQRALVQQFESRTSRVNSNEFGPAATTNSAFATGSTPPPRQPSDTGVTPVAFAQAEASPLPEPLDATSPPKPYEELGQFTLERLEEVALVSNPTLAEAQAQLDAAHGRWVQAGLPPNTVLGFSGQQLGSHGQAEQTGVFIGQQVIRGGKLQLSRAVIDQEIAVAERRLETQRRRVLTDVGLGYYDVLVAQRRLELLEQMVQISEEGSRVADMLLRAKEVSQADVLRSTIELQTNSVALKVARNQFAGAWSRLSVVLGTPDMPPQSLAGDLENPDLDLSQSEVLQQLLAESPELHAVLFEIDRSRLAIARAQSEGVPNLDIQGIFQYDNATGSNNGALQVSMPIPWLNYNQGGIREAQANLAAAQFAVGRVELSLQRRLASVFQRYASARDQVQDYSKSEGILANAKKSLEMVRAGYQAGEYGYVDMLTAQRTYAQTNLSYIEAVGDLWAAIVEIEGLLLKDSLDDRGTAK